MNKFWPIVFHLGFRVLGLGLNKPWPVYHPTNEARQHKEWIKSMFKGHGLHKPNHATWAEAEGQLCRYLNQRPSGPIPPVDVAALLRKSDALESLG